MNDHLVVETLEAAKKILEENELEWCQGIQYNYDESDNIIGVCAVGAISLAAASVTGLNDRNNRDDDRYFVFNETAIVATFALRNFLPTEDFITVQGYNDDSSTTKEDILLLFKRVINEF
jgi:hypothetical protein